MDTKFTFNIENQNYANGASIDRVFSNHYGKWFVCIGTTTTNFRFRLFFSPNPPITPETLKHMTVAVVFKNAAAQVYSFEQKAIQRENSTVFEFDAASKGLYGNCRTFNVSIEIDAESLPPVNLPCMSEFAKKMYNEEKAADITIKTADGKKIKASKFILSRSPVFDAMLNAHDTKEAQEGIIEIADIKHEVMTEVIRYMYCDEVPKIEEMAQDLLIAANKYDLPGLVAKVVHHMKLTVNDANYAEYLELADALNLVDIKKSIMDFVIENYEHVYFEDQWKMIKVNNAQLALQVYEKHLEIDCDDDDDE